MDADRDGQRERRSLLAVDLGLAANALLAALKSILGVAGHSPALLADGINSVSDVAYSLVVRVLMVFARKPADAEHPYGHERLESIGALVVGCFVLATGVAVLLAAARQVWALASGASHSAGAEAYALWVALLTMALKLALWTLTARISRRTANPAVAALALDHRNDVLAAGAAAAGITLGRAGLPWADPAAAGLVALVILRTGISVLRESSNDLLGAQPGQPMARQIREWLLGVPGVREVQEVRAHSFGPFLVLNVTIGIDGTLSVAAGDAIADEVERVLHERVEFLRQVHVHYHPVGSAPAALAARP
jgi:cation diffusion facilitator family transporter